LVHLTGNLINVAMFTGNIPPLGKSTIYSWMHGFVSE
jgi:hypothetical protein